MVNYLRKEYNIPYKFKHTVTKWSFFHLQSYLFKRKEQMCPHKPVYMGVQCSIIHDSPKLEAIQMFTSRQMDKQIVIYPLYRILLSNYKE